MIVLHHTGSSADAVRIARFFQNPDAQASAHYIIDRDGEIVRSVRDEMRAWHAGNSSFDGADNINQRSLGIELCNLGDNGEMFTREQITSLIQLMASLSAEYGIPESRFVRHRDVAVPAGRKLDTADNLDVDAVYDSVVLLREGGELILPVYDLTVRGESYTGPRLYEVREGDSWEMISWLIYDSPGLADALRKANPGDLPKAGEVIHIPENPFE